MEGRELRAARGGGLALPLDGCIASIHPSIHPSPFLSCSPLNLPSSVPFIRPPRSPHHFSRSSIQTIITVASSTLFRRALSTASTASLRPQPRSSLTSAFATKASFARPFSINTVRMGVHNLSKYVSTPSSRILSASYPHFACHCRSRDARVISQNYEKVLTYLPS
jgi:hypothetical protein